MAKIEARIQDAKKRNQVKRKTGDLEEDNEVIKDNEMPRYVSNFYFV